VDFKVNDSPFRARREYVTAGSCANRLFRSSRRTCSPGGGDGRPPDVHRVGPGELHLGILMETMRREGFEFQVSRPRIIPREGPNGERLEPYEELMIDLPEGYLGW